MVYRTSDQIAREFIAEGRRRRISTIGIVTCIATGLVESNLTVYANWSVPESLKLPHDAVGEDGMSVGPLQQQVRKGENGRWWWADAKTCMDPTTSAGLFYAALSHLDYTRGHNPGMYAQMVQKSAYPDRYQQRMGEAQSIYDRLAGQAGSTIVLKEATVPKPEYRETQMWSTSRSSRNRATVDAFFLHTQEGGGGDQAAENLARYLNVAANNVSYHYVVSQASNGSVDVVDVVDTDYSSWSVLSANPRSINLCFAGSRAGWTRAEWMSQSKAIDVAAYLTVQDCAKYRIPLNVIGPPYDRRLPGISDHRYVTRVLGDGSHTDVGDQFPLDVFTDRIKFWAGDTPPKPPATAKDVFMALTDQQQNDLYNAVMGIASAAADIQTQLRGPGLRGWPQLGSDADGRNLTLVDAIAKLVVKDAS